MRPGARSHGTSYLQGGAAGFRPQAQKLLDLLAKDPFASPPRFEKLVGSRGLARPFVSKTSKPRM